MATLLVSANVSHAACDETTPCTNLVTSNGAGNVVTGNTGLNWDETSGQLGIGMDSADINAVDRVGIKADPTNPRFLAAYSSNNNRIVSIGPDYEGGFIGIYPDVSSNPSSIILLRVNTDETPEGSTAVVVLKGLTTSDPESEGQLWNDNGTLKISSGN
jgi:hypothetical protein